MQFRVAIDAFIQFCAVERRLSSHTTQAYACDLADFHKWLGPQVGLAEITMVTLKNYLEDMVGQRKLTTSTVRRRLACLRAFFRFLSELSEASDPFEGWRLKLPRRKQLPRSLSRNEAHCLLSSFNLQSGEIENEVRITFSLVIRLMISTGLRVGEVCKLTTDDVAPDGTIIRIQGKGSKERVVYITHVELALGLQQLILQRRAYGHTALFINRHGSPVRPQSIRLMLRSIARDAGLSRRITPHMLRHTAATLLIETGVDIRFVQRLLGHSSIATTEIYTHVSDEALKATLARANVLETITA